MFKSLIRNSLYVLGSSFLSKGLNFVIGFLVARNFGSAEYGKFGIAFSTASMIMIFSGLGLGMTAIKYISEYKSKNPDELSVVCSSVEMIGFISTLIFFISIVVFNEEIATYFYNDFSVIPLINLCAFLVLFNNLASISNAVLQGFERFDLVFRANLISTCMTMIIVGISFVFDAVYFVVLAFVLTAFITFVIKSAFCYKLKKDQSVFYTLPKFSVMKPMILYAVPTLLNGICFLPALWFSKTILVRSSSGFEQLGLFDASYQWMTIIMVLTGAVSSVIFPMLSSQNDKDKFFKIYMYGITISLLIPLILIVIIYPFAGYISQLYGEGFNSLEQLIPLAIIISLFYSLWSVMSKVAASKNRPWTVFLGNITWTILMFSIAPNLIAKYSAKGLYFSMLIAWVVVVIYFLFENLMYFRKRTSYG